MYCLCSFNDRILILGRQWKKTLILLTYKTEKNKSKNSPQNKEKVLEVPNTNRKQSHQLELLAVPWRERTGSISRNLWA